MSDGDAFVQERGWSPTRRNFVIGAVFLLAVCDYGSETKLRHRLVVDVGTPAGVVSGAAVRETLVQRAPRWAPGLQVTFEGRGEAVAIDLPNGQTLFALLGTTYFPDAFIRLPIELFVQQAEYERTGESDTSQRVKQLMRDQPSAPVTGDNRPRLVRFRDISDPSTMEEVDPDQLSDAFGSGYYLQGMTISITTDRVTTGIGDRLPWLRDLPPGRVGQPADSFTGSLAPSDLAVGT